MPFRGATDGASLADGWTGVVILIVNHRNVLVLVRDEILQPLQYGDIE